ncbi:MAG: fimbrial protein [Serratia sp. (in: enterobacteria)]|uniref:fimbrial protein n=1 Tax=Serratia sp. (in: enterobacteria) TaxID=616 RepID=UPI003F356F9C
MNVFIGNTLMLLIGVSLMTPAQAVNVNFSGTLQAPPPCTINNGNLIDVDFGEKVAIKKVDGSNYIQRVNYTINCEPGVPGWTLGLTFQGSAAAYDKAAVQTNKSALGIRMLRNGEPFTMNTRFEIDSAAPPVLQVVPVKDPAKDLTDGPFEASATLFADYQ